MKKYLTESESCYMEMDNRHNIRLSPFQRIIRGHLQHYNEKKYWSRRNKVVSADCKLPKIIKYYYLYYVKRCDAFNNATTGPHLGFGARFASIPQLPHGLYGIVVSHNAVVGENAVIYHQVTIGEGRNGAPNIGDNVLIGAGAKILGNVRIGSGSVIGAGAVVTFDVPDNSIVRAAKGTILEK